jgi:hypothetical protein
MSGVVEVEEAGADQCPFVISPHYLRRNCRAFLPSLSFPPSLSSSIAVKFRSRKMATMLNLSVNIRHQYQGSAFTMAWAACDDDISVGSWAVGTTPMYTTDHRQQTTAATSRQQASA